jgi:DNA-binding MarR family transcriptional regulator
MIGATNAEICSLARFRYAIRKFLHSSDEVVRQAGLTPQHHQLLLGIAGFTGNGSANIGELAEFLQVRHHSVVGLVDRAEAMHLVRRATNPENRREVRVSLTADGLRKLRMLTELHRRELQMMRRGVNLPHLERGAARRQAVNPRPLKPQKRRVS